MRMEINPAYEHMRDFVVALPERFDHEGTLIYDDRNVIKKFDVAGETVVVKRYRRPLFVQRVAYTFSARGRQGGRSTTEQGSSNSVSPRLSTSLISRHKATDFWNMAIS